MHPVSDILSYTNQRSSMEDELVLLYEKTQQTPGSVQYRINRYSKFPMQEIEDTGMMAYHYKKEDPRESYLELRFCVAGNMYCSQKESECANCGGNRNRCAKQETIDIISFTFSVLHISQFVHSLMLQNNLTADILRFKHTTSFSKTLPLCGRTRVVLEGLMNHKYSDVLENIFINAQSQMLLLYSLECIIGDKEVESFSCKFLANEADREKISKAREILLENLGEPITIKELSRKVAINECYLKKGFKEMFGTTVFDFYQSQRMEHARYLLYEKSLSVTDVSMLLGYSSISHFSTAFKKHTGLKPCELLFK
jgi:AraC family transcriptional regulator